MRSKPLVEEVTSYPDTVYAVDDFPRWIPFSLICRAGSLHHPLGLELQACTHGLGRACPAMCSLRGDHLPRTVAGSGDAKTTLLLTPRKHVAVRVLLGEPPSLSDLGQAHTTPKHLFSQRKPSLSREEKLR